MITNIAPVPDRKPDQSYWNGGLGPPMLLRQSNERMQSWLDPYDGKGGYVVFVDRDENEYRFRVHVDAFGGVTHLTA